LLGRSPPPSGVDGNGPKRFSVQRKMAIVARLLRGEPLELVARETNVSIARLTEWRERALAGAATALKAEKLLAQESLGTTAVVPTPGAVDGSG
jgi:transposase-like protein